MRIVEQTIALYRTKWGNRSAELDTYGLAGDDVIVLEVTDPFLPGTFIQYVGSWRRGFLASNLNLAEIHLVSAFLLPLVTDPRLARIFIALQSALVNYTALGNVIFDAVTGNVAGNYDNATGEYTFDGAQDGKFSTSMTVTDAPGGAGTTVSLVSSIQGVLDFATVANNTTVAIDLGFTGSFVTGEVIEVVIDTADADILAGAEFMFEI